MIKTIVCSMIGFAVALSLILILGTAPEWIGAGAKENPLHSAIFLLLTSLCATLLLFDKKSKARSNLPDIT